MNLVFETALEIQEFCETRGWKFCFIGGVAVHRWGEPRATDDVDLTLLTGFGAEEGFVDELLRHYQARPPCDRDFALVSRVLLLITASQVPVDAALGGTDFEIRSIERSSIWVAGGRHSLRTCCAEDLLIHKCFANRDQDWVDVDGILARQHGKLNLALVREELKPLVLLKEQPEILDKLERRIAHHDQPFTKIKPTRRPS